MWSRLIKVGAQTDLKKFAVSRGGDAGARASAKQWTLSPTTSDPDVKRSFYVSRSVRQGEIAYTFRDGETAVLLPLGAANINTAIKGVAIARKCVGAPNITPCVLSWPHARPSRALFGVSPPLFDTDVSSLVAPLTTSLPSRCPVRYLQDDGLDVTLKPMWRDASRRASTASSLELRARAYNLPCGPAGFASVTDAHPR